MMPKHRRITLNTTSLILASLLLLPVAGSAQRYQTADGKTRVALIKMPYSGARNVPELSDSPDYLEAGVLAGRITWGDVDLKATQTVGLNEEEARQYGEWHRMGMANGHLAEMVAENERASCQWACSPTARRSSASSVDFNTRILRGDCVK